MLKKFKLFKFFNFYIFKKWFKPIIKKNINFELKNI